MHHLMARFWWILAVRGVLGIALGLMAFVLILSATQIGANLFGLSLFVKPSVIVATLIFLISLYAFLDGLFAILLGLQNYGEGRRWWGLVVEGAISVGLGLFTWLRPELAVVLLLYFIAAWAILTGLLEILQGFNLNEYKERRKPFLFFGLCSVIFGCIVFLPVGGLGLAWLIAIYAFLSGIPLFSLGLRLRPFVKVRGRS